jgi:ubiquitin-conjugating enzyme E2 H
MNSTGEELSDEEDVSDEESGSSDEEDEIAGHVDP